MTFSSYKYYFADGNDHADGGEYDQPYDYSSFENNHVRSNRHHQPQHALLTPHGAMTEILAATGSSSPQSNKQQQLSTAQNSQSATSNSEAEAKKSLRLKAAKHFHRGGAGSTQQQQLSTKEVQPPSKVAAIRSSNKYFYPEESITPDDGKDNQHDVNTQANNINNSSGANDEDDPAIQFYEESVSDIGSGYNSGSDLENAARKILRRKQASSSTSTKKYHSDGDDGDTLSDTGSAESSTITGNSQSTSTLRKLPDGWKERIVKRKAGITKLPPTMDKKEKKIQVLSQQQFSKGNDDDDPNNDHDFATGGGNNQYYNHFDASFNNCDDSDDNDEYYQDHFNDNANSYYGAVFPPSLNNQYNSSNNINHGMKEDDGQFPNLHHAPILYEQHIFGPIQPSTIYESNDEYEQDDDDKYHNELSVDGDRSPLFKDEWCDDFTSIKDNKGEKKDNVVVDRTKNDANSFVKIEIDESGFPSPSRRKTKSHEEEEIDESGFPSPTKRNAKHEVDEAGFPSPSRKNKSHLSEETIVDGSIDSLRNEFDKDDYFNVFSTNNEDWGQKLSIPSGVQWKSSTKRGTATPSPNKLGLYGKMPQLPPITDDDILATFSDDKGFVPNAADEDAAVLNFAWSESSFRDNVDALTSAQYIAKEGNNKESLYNIIKSPQGKTTVRASSPTMRPFSEQELSDAGSDTGDVKPPVKMTISPSKKGLNFFKRKGRRYHSEGERSDSEWESKKSPARLKSLAPLSRKSKLYHSEGERSESEWDTDSSKNSLWSKTSSLSQLRRKNNNQKRIPKNKESPRRRILFGTPPKKAEKSHTPALAKNSVSAKSPVEPNLKPRPGDAATPTLSNKMKSAMPLASVRDNEDDATDDKTVSSLGSIITRESSTKASKTRVVSSNASASTAMSEIERLRKENDKLRQELERQAVLRENERLRRELDKQAVAHEAALSPHRPMHPDSGGESPRVKRNPRNGMYRSTLSSLLESDAKGNHHHRNLRHRGGITKNHLMNQADFDEESITTYSPTSKNGRFEFRDEFSGPMAFATSATGWMASQVRNAAQGAQGQRSLDCFTACTRKDRGLQRRRRRRRNGSKGTVDDVDDESDTYDSLEEDSFTRNVRKPRPPIARRKARGEQRSANS